MIMLAEVYTPEEDPLAVLARRDRGAVSVYARGQDYHDLVKPRLKRLGRWLVAETGAAIKVFVDTAPVMEKPLAQAAGLGWQGKHTNLLSRELGNWFFLGAIFTTLELPRDAAGEDHCGSCRACLDVCPTGALPAPYQLDARRCISYLTIEHDGPVDEELRPLMGNRIYGCDDCLAVCPWNKFAAAAREAGYAAREELDGAAAGGAGGARRCGVPGDVPRVADQADRAEPVRAQRRLCDRQFRRPGAAAGGRGWRRTRTRWCAMPAPGRWRGWRRRLSAGGGRRRSGASVERAAGWRGRAARGRCRGGGRCSSSQTGAAAGLSPVSASGGAGLEERLRQVGIERAGALGLGERARRGRPGCAAPRRGARGRARRRARRRARASSVVRAAGQSASAAAARASEELAVGGRGR